MLSASGDFDFTMTCSLLVEKWMATQEFKLGFQLFPCLIECGVFQSHRAGFQLYIVSPEGLKVLLSSFQGGKDLYLIYFSWDYVILHVEEDENSSYLYTGDL